MIEQATIFQCNNSQLLGIVHCPEMAIKVGLIIVVAGGPQYRVGVNRQFVMMGRMFAKQNIPVLRFDHRGIGDSGGQYRGFVDMDDDIRSAIDELMTRFPDLDKIILWGECESASAIAFYAHTDPRVSGLIMINPWIRTEQGEAKTYLKHYYLSRLFDKELWHKIFSGKFSITASFKSFLELLFKARNSSNNSKNIQSENQLSQLPLPVRLEKSVDLYNGDIYIITSGRDLIAQEFSDYCKSSDEWQNILNSKRLKIDVIQEADHTFSRIEWRSELFSKMNLWIEDNFVKY